MSAFNTHMIASPQLNLDAIKRKQKGLHKVLGGLAVPFYYTEAEVVEGQPMKLDPSTPFRMNPLADNTEGALARGLAMQVTYQEATTGQLAQLAGYNFANDTAQRLDGQPIGLLTGHGFAKTNNYVGDVAPGQQAYVTANGKSLTADNGGGAGSKLPIVFEGEGSDGEVPVLIRFDFPMGS